MLLWLLLACGFVADVATGDVTKVQLERLCEVAGELDAEHGLSDDERLRRIGKELAGDQLVAVRRAWRAIEKAPPKVRGKLYRELLDQAGLPGFRCQPLEDALR